MNTKLEKPPGNHFSNVKKVSSPETLNVMITIGDIMCFLFGYNSQIVYTNNYIVAH